MFQTIKMKTYLGAIVFMCAVVFAVTQETYSDKYDHVDVEEILNNPRLYQKYFDCIMGKGKCTPEGAELKEKIPDALKDECAKCSEKQKAVAEKILRFLITEKKDDWKLLEEKYDSEGTYRKKYEAKRKLLEEGKPVLV